MLDARRMLWLFTFVTFGGLPACITVAKKLPPKESTTEPAKKTTESTSSTSKTTFAEMKPGTRVALNADPKLVAKQNGPEPPAAPTDDAEAVRLAGLRERLKEPPPLPTIPSIDPPLVAALKAFMENDPQRAVEALKSLDKSTQDFLIATMPAIARAAQMNMANADPAAVATIAEQLHAAAQMVEPRAALGVKAAICRKIEGFGRYDPWPKNEPFQPNDIAELYVEVRHLTCEPSAKDGFVTRQETYVEIRNAAGRFVDQTNPENPNQIVPKARYKREKVSRSPVHDYHWRYLVTMPSTPGTYTVTVEVRDAAGTRTARSQPIEVRVGP